MTAWRRAAGWLGVLLVAVGLGAVPYRALLPVYPCGRDAVKWIAETDPSREGWLQWALFDNHFVAYRPVTALSFAANHVAFGEGPWSWRGVDIALHVVCGLLVAATWRALATAERRGWGWATLAAALFLASPVGESVVPFVARRSYSLATALGLAALVVWLGAERSARPWIGRAAGAGLLLAAALANETAYVLVPVFALASWSARRPANTQWRELGLDLGPVALATGLGVVSRIAVLGGVGGYRVDLTARVDDGVRMVALGSSPAEVFGLAWSHAALPATPSGDPSYLLAVGPWFGAALAGWAVAASVAAYRRKDALPALLLVWAAGYAALAALSGTWFVRMAYPMVAPVALWLTWAAAEAAVGVGARGWRAAHGLAVGAVVMAWLQVATPVRGLDRHPIREQFLASRFVRSAVAEIRELEGPAFVWLAVPVDLSRVGSTVRWIRRQVPEDVAIGVLAVTEPNVHPRDRLLVVEGDRVRPVTGVVWDPRVGGHAGLPMRSLRRPDRPAWIFDRTLIPVPAATPAPAP